MISNGKPHVSAGWLTLSSSCWLVYGNVFLIHLVAGIAAWHCTEEGGGD